MTRTQESQLWTPGSFHCAGVSSNLLGRSHLSEQRFELQNFLNLRNMADSTVFSTQASAYKEPVITSNKMLLCTFFLHRLHVPKEEGPTYFIPYFLPWGWGVRALLSAASAYV